MGQRMTGGCACGRIRYTATIRDHDGQWVEATRGFPG
jgi:hypothetical protein